MKRITSVWMAAFRNLWWKLLVILLLLTAAELVSFDSTLSRLAKEQAEYDWLVISFQMVIEQAKLYWHLFGAFVVLTALCCLQGCRFSGKNRYLLQRLTMPEWLVTWCWHLPRLKPVQNR